MSMESMATELLKELKASARRWFIAFLVMIILEIGTILGFMKYINDNVLDSYTVTQEVTDTDMDNSTITQRGVTDGD